MSSTRTTRGSLAKRSWTRLSDEQLLGLRFCDLKLKIERSPVAKRVKRLYSELDKRQISFRPPLVGESAMSIGTILIILVIIYLLGGFSGRFGGYGYGYGHGGVGVIGVILIILLVLVLMGRL